MQNASLARWFLQAIRANRIIQAASVIICTNQLADDTLGKWANFTGSWSQKFYQFLTAIRSIFLQPRVEPVINWVGCEYSCPWLYKTSYDIRFDLFGWVVLIICILPNQGYSPLPWRRHTRHNRDITR